jgi:hypothetical protein
MLRSSVSGNRGKNLRWNSHTATTSPAYPHPTPTIPLPPAYEIRQLPPPQFSATDPKSPLEDHLQLASWPPHYQVAPPPKYHGNMDPHKFLMPYKAAIALVGGDDTTLAKSLIISLEDAVANWYSRLPLKCIYFGQ